jgi:iron complex outermembrane receptor protein
MTKRKIEYFAAVFGLYVGTSGVQLSQAQDDLDLSVLEEIIVTAEHREASVQDTQIAITALSAQDIIDQGIRNTTDLGHVAPNVVINSLQGGKSGVAVNMRGIGQNETLSAWDPAVGVYIDDVLIAKNVGAVLDVLDIERIEVLRGPQGTLYGRNTMGGTISYVSKKPTDEFEGKVTATLGDYGQQDLVVVINAPITDNLSARLTAANIQRDGLTKNIALSDPAYAGQSAYTLPLPYAASTDLYTAAGANDYSELRTTPKELETKDRQVGMLHVAWEPTDNLSLLYTYDFTRIDEIPGTPWTTVTNPAPGFSAGTAVLGPWEIDVGADRPDTIAVDGAHVARTDVDGHALHIDFGLTDSLTFKSITSVREMENLSMADSDGSPIAIFQTVDVNTNDQFTQEFRLTGSAMDDRLSFTTGFFYMDEDGIVDNRVDILMFTGSALLGPERSLSDFNNTNWAIYGQATYSINDQLDITFGARYTEEDREMTKSWRPRGINKLPAPFGNGYPDMIDFGTVQNDYDNLSPMASVSYHWNEDIMTYFKISSGYQSGGFNVRDVVVEQTPPFAPLFFADGFEEEEVIAYELGIKSNFDNRARLNIALWYSDYDNKRTSTFDPNTLSNLTSNAGVVKIYGVEVELLAQLTESFQLGFSYGLQKPKYSEYMALVETPPGSGIAVLSDLSDTPFGYSPENSAGLNLLYETNIGIGYLKARLDWAYKDDYWFVVNGDGANNQEAYTLLNGRLAIEEIAGPADTFFTVALWGKNITDQGYYFNGVDIFNSFGFDFNLYAEPRTYGLDVTWNF